MNHLETFLTQAYTQAPGRRQRQFIGIFLVFLVFSAVVSGIYLSVSSKAALIGRDIQAKQRTIETLERDTEDLEAKLAEVLSSAEMETRARRLGFQTIQADQMVYMNIPGYVEQPPIILAPTLPRTIADAPVMPEQYTESLFAWLKRQLAGKNLNLLGVPQ